MNLQQRWCDLTVAQWIAVDRGIWLSSLLTNLLARPRGHHPDVHGNDAAGETWQA